MYTLFYAAQDVSITSEGLKYLDTWSVYSQQYGSIGDPEPIEGSAVLVSGNLTESEALKVAIARQRASYSLARQEHSDG